MARDKKYQVFISSTYTDLISQRNELVRATLKLNHIPVGMELISAGDSEQWNVIQRTIDQCDYYAIVVACRYGSVVDIDGMSISFTEREYDYAVKIGVPVMGFLLDETALWPNDKRETEIAKMNSLVKFRDKVGAKKWVSKWKTTEELGREYVVALTNQIAETPRRGWIPTPQEDPEAVTYELARLSRENHNLRERLNSLMTMPEAQAEVRIALQRADQIVVLNVKPDVSGDAKSVSLGDMLSDLCELTRNPVKQWDWIREVDQWLTKTEQRDTALEIYRPATEILSDLIALRILTMEDGAEPKHEVFGFAADANSIARLTDFGSRVWGAVRFRAPEQDSASGHAGPLVPRENPPPP